MKIRYVGPHTKVEIVATGQTVERDQVVDVDTDVAKALLEQDTWKKATTKKTKE